MYNTFANLFPLLKISIKVNTNGVISFLVQVSQYTPDAFPLGDNRRVVAPFWGDVDTRIAGQVFYRETSDPALLQQATDDVTSTYVDHRQFRATWLLIATWYEVAFYGASGINRNKASNLSEKRSFYIYLLAYLQLSYLPICMYRPTNLVNFLPICLTYLPTSRPCNPQDPEERTASRQSIFLAKDNRLNLLLPCITRITYYMYCRSNYCGLLSSWIHKDRIGQIY